MTNYIIVDWTSTVIFNKKKFKSFDDAEEFLSEFLGDKYETDRQEYYIEEEKSIRYSKFLEPNGINKKLKKVAKS